MSENIQILKKLQSGAFREVDMFLSELPDELLQEKLAYILLNVLDEPVGVDQIALRNLLHFHKGLISRMVA